MSPQVEAAWIALVGVVIGVGGTVIVAWLGFRNTRAATEKTVDAARSERLWNRKADAYQATLAEALQHRNRLSVLAESFRPGPGQEQAAAEYLKSGTRNDFGELQGMLSTFGSTEVVKACLIYQKADRTAYDRLARWCRAICALADARRRGSGQSVSETEAESQAKKAFSAAVDAALATGGALQKAIHDDLDKESRWHSA
jgi:hypothetical protein